MTAPPSADEVAAIEMVCPYCDRKQHVPRDEFDPPTATRLSLQCIGCDDGDRHSPEYFDAEGKWVSPINHLMGGSR